MQPAALLTLAVALAMDATAVAAARGLAARRLRTRHVLEVAVCFGGFQALMPLLGYVVGDRFGHHVAAWDHYVAFVLLGGLGLKMLHEARGAGEDADALPHDDAVLFAPRTLVLLGIATSVDAFAAGLTLPMLGVPLVTSIATIGATTALLSALGLHLGRRFGRMVGPRLDAFGGVVLIGLGTKILIEHLYAS